MQQVRPQTLDAVLGKLTEAGACIEIGADSIRLICRGGAHVLLI